MKRRNNHRFTILVLGFIVGAIGLSVVKGMEYYETRKGKNGSLEVNHEIEDEAFYMELTENGEASIEDKGAIVSNIIRINIPSEIYISNKDYTGRVEIHNTEDHMYALEVELMLEETGDTIYKSHILYPNDSLEIITLTTPIEIGIHKVRAVFIAYQKDSMEEVTSMAFHVLLHVVNTI